MIISILNTILMNESNVQRKHKIKLPLKTHANKTFSIEYRKEELREEQPRHV